VPDRQHDAERGPELLTRRLGGAERTGAIRGDLFHLDCRGRCVATGLFHVLLKAQERGHWVKDTAKADIGMSTLV
jgi:hypothetical protein